MEAHLQEQKKLIDDVVKTAMAEMGGHYEQLLKAMEDKYENQVSNLRTRIIDGTLDEHKAHLASINLEGKAIKWHQSFLEIKGEQVLSNWEEYVEGLKARFDDKAYEDPMSNLISLKQTGTVEEFQEQFDTLFPQTGINEKQALFSIEVVEDDEGKEGEVFKEAIEELPDDSNPHMFVHALSRGSNGAYRTMRVSLKMVGSKGMVRLLKKEGQASSIHLYSLIVEAIDGRGTWQTEENKAKDASKKVSIYPKLEKLLLEYADLFAKPKGLPHHRAHDHKSCLKEGTDPINQRPYRYARVQKDVIEKMTQELLQTEGFHWSREASEAFESLKHVVITTPVLVLPDFSKEFVVKTDASNVGIGAILLQQGHPIAFINKALSLRHQSLSVFEKKLLALIYAVRKWSHYLIGRHFIVKTDHHSLKYLLEQRISTPLQQAWLAKLMGYDFSISYKKGKENVVADALSRVSSNQLMQMAVSKILPGIYEEVRLSWEVNPVLREICNKLQQGSLKDSAYTWSEGQLRRKGRLVVGKNAALRRKLIHLVHDSALGGHSGIQASTKRLAFLFYWKGLEKDVRQYIRQCDVCQRYKPKNTPTPGLLQPLPIPEAIWTQVSMDFITGLPKSYGKDAIFVVVDRLTKYAHFIALQHPYSALTVAQAYMDNELFKLQGVELQCSSTYHPQTDGQTEVVNMCLENYLRCMNGDRPIEWSKWLPLAEWWQESAQSRPSHKLAAKYFGPFQVIDKVGKVAYKLALPDSSQIHPVIHVSQLKKKVGVEIQVTTQFPVDLPLLVMIEHVAVLGRKMVKRGNRAATKVLV
ncbi:hypothetical protein SLEP1_g24501 [Rubroshorea leprosula]|uniref:Integrase catalytic domain-containing protein n=1 Tax=Rubroshorea leprosula TaxID=152421 RepID=A0AAV5JM66_9ROSI|nr:hypothetical protein SLEP1_g24501 [Rubroshorea leprosula]